MLQVSLLVVFLNDHPRGVAPLLHWLDPVVIVYESGRLDTRLLDLLNKHKSLLELIFDILILRTTKTCTLREVKAMGIDICFQVSQLLELLPEVVKIRDVND